VRFSVVAVNAIGPSTPAFNSGPIWSDIIPPPPAALSSRPLDSGLRVGWKKPADSGGSPIEQYIVVVGGVAQTIPVSVSDPVGTQYFTNIQAPGTISNGTAVSFSVSARNSAPNSLATWNEADGSDIPAGAPLVAGSPTASGSTTDGTTASVAWAGAFATNGATITDYWVAIYTGSAPSCTVSGVDVGNPHLDPPSGARHLDGGTTSTDFSGLSANQTYSITVYAYNGQGCTPSPQVQVTPRAAPGTVTGITLSGPVPSGDGTWDYRIDAFMIASGSTDADSFLYQYTTGAEGSVHGPIKPGTNDLLTNDGSQYGHSVSVAVKACKQYPEGTLCSQDWSAPFTLGTPVNNSVPGALTATASGPVSGDWSWGSSPTGDYDSMQYSCDKGRTWTDIAFGAAGACHATGVPSNADLQFRIQADGVLGGFVRSYSWTDYQQ
jgi:hypothetical protein